MARKKSITKRRRGLFLDKLAVSGNVSAAAVAGEISRRAWYNLRDRDEEFAEAWDDAELAYLDSLEGVSIKRGVVGEIEKRPYTYYNKDGSKETRFREVTTKSDQCLLATLKARHPAYKDKRSLEHTSPDGSMTPERKTADYSNLSDDELAQLTALERKARGETATA